MAKTDYPLSQVDLSRVFRKPGKPAFLGDKPVNGYDTETADGRVFMLAASFQSVGGKVWHNHGDILSPEVVFGALTNRNAREGINVWYNLDYDANCLLSLLPADSLYSLTVLGRIDWEGYEITYIPGKFLSIKDPNRHTYSHFDVSQFFFGSLAKVSAERLNIPKLDNVDVKLFGLENGKVNQYIRDQWDKILEYIERDAELPRQLWADFARESEALEIPCGRPYSTGYLAEQYLNTKFDEEYKPGFGYVPMQEHALQAYRGGRFEIFKRGSVGEIITVDINSAYPYIARDLPDPGSLRWSALRNPSVDDIRSYRYGIVRATVTTDATRPIQPFAVRKDGRLLFPALRNYTVNVTLPEFLYAVESGLVLSYTIHRAWVGKETWSTRYPFHFIQALYDERNRLKEAGEDKKQQALKIILNSIYGKLIQLTDFVAAHPEDAEFPSHWIFHPTELYPKEVQEYIDRMKLGIHKEIKAGVYFNPFLGAYITGLTRLNLLRSTIEAGLEHDTVMFATDSVMFNRAAYDESNFARDHVRGGLGGWGVEAEGDGFIVGSGVYQIELPNGDLKKRFRGVASGFGGWDVAYKEDLRKAVGMAIEEKGRDVIPLTTTRPLRISQMIWQHFDQQEVGKFLTFPKSIAAGMDVKRNWPRGESVKWRELIDAEEISSPFLLDREGQSI